MAERAEIVLWVGRCILPYEAEVRAWLRRASVPAHEIDDVIQESYCKMAALESSAHITNPRAYFFQVARSLIYQQARRARIVRIETVAEMDALSILDDGPNPEEEVISLRELEHLRAMIAALPERCRQVFVLRKIEGVPQREIAARLGISESTVEAQVTRGLKLILKAWSEGTREPKGMRQEHDGKNRHKRQRD
jgi:RNA polymerase sigma factor (sigma-70 family)